MSDYKVTPSLFSKLRYREIAWLWLIVKNDFFLKSFLNNVFVLKHVIYSRNTTYRNYNNY